MWLSDLSIKQPVLITMAVLATLVLGTMAYLNLPIDFYPDVSFPAVSVVTIYPGASPNEVEDQVSIEIEEAMSTLPGIDSIQASSSEGLSTVVVLFDLEVDSSKASQNVRERMATIRGTLPADILEPSIATFDPTDLPVMEIAVAAKEGLPGETRQLVEDDIAPRLQRVQGVADVEVAGGFEREIQVQLNATALKSRRISPQQVVAAIVARSFSIPGGNIDQAGRNFLLRTPGNFDTYQEIGELPINGSGLKVRDLAEVQDTFKEPIRYSRLNAENAVVISIRKESGSNTIQVAEEVHKEVERLHTTRPDIELTVVRDNSEFVKHSFDDAIKELILGALTASFVVLIFFRDIRNTIVTVAGLPVIMIGTFAIMQAMGLTLNIISLLALALCVGLVIDDAIVVRENVFRHMERGATPKEAASRGTAEVTMPVIAMTLTVVCVFLPIGFTGGVIGRFFQSFGIVVSVAILISMVEAFTMAPMLSAYFFKQIKTDKKYEIDPDDPLLAEIDDAHEQGFLDRLYASLLRWTLNHKFLTVLFGIGILVVSVYAATFLKVDYLPPADEGTLDMALELPPGTALSETNVAAAQIEERILSLPEVDAILSNIGGQGSPEKASFFVKLHDGNSSEAFEETIRAEFLADFPYLNIAPPSDGGGGGGGKEIEITLETVSNPQALNDYSLELMQELSQIAGFVDVESSYKPGKPEILLVVNRQRASDLGLDMATVGSTVRTLVEGDEVATFRGEGTEADIRVQLRPEDRDQLQEVLQLPIATTRGMVPLRQVVHLEETTGPTQLQRVNRINAVTLGGNTFGRERTDILLDMQAMLDSATFPEGVEYRFSGTQEQQDDAFSGLIQAMLLSVLFVYMVLASQFGSFTQPFIIMMALPLSIIGAFVALLLVGLPLDITVMIGFIMLMGLVTKNSILLVDLTNRLRRARNTPIDEALLIASPIRLRPILMTAISLILGMLPVAIGLGEGSDFRRPMSVAIIGGLITSTLLTLIIVPTVYSLVETLLEAIRRYRQPAEEVEPSLTSAEPMTANL